MPDSLDLKLRASVLATRLIVSSICGIVAKAEQGCGRVEAQMWRQCGVPHLFKILSTGCGEFHAESRQKSTHKNCGIDGPTHWNKV
jgi:hypothetical protein